MKVLRFDKAFPNSDQVAQAMHDLASLDIHQLHALSELPPWEVARHVRQGTGHTGHLGEAALARLARCDGAVLKKAVERLLQDRA